MLDLDGCSILVVVSVPAFLRFAVGFARYFALDTSDPARLAELKKLQAQGQQEAVKEAIKQNCRAYVKERLTVREHLRYKQRAQSRTRY